MEERKYQKITRYMTVGLAVIEGVAMADRNSEARVYFDTETNRRYVWTIIVQL